MNPSPTPSPHHPNLLFLPGNSLAPLPQSFNLCLQKRSLSSFIYCPISHLLLTLSPLLYSRNMHLTLSPILSKLANLSFSTGTFPSIFKKAQVLPLLKKPNLDPTSPANYRPISNLSTMSILLERLLLSRLRPHITTSSNFSSFQSAYRPGFSTETALLHIFNNLSDICGKGNCAVMLGLDLSAAFDTINHQLLLERLKSDFGIDGLAFSWLQSYLSNRTQYVKLGKTSSSPVELLAGVPQGSVLGPLLFTTYTSPLSNTCNFFAAAAGDRNFLDSTAGLYETAVWSAVPSALRARGRPISPDNTASLGQCFWPRRSVDHLYLRPTAFSGFPEVAS